MTSPYTKRDQSRAAHHTWLKRNRKKGIGGGDGHLPSSVSREADFQLPIPFPYDKGALVRCQPCHFTRAILCAKGSLLANKHNYKENDITTLNHRLKAKLGFG